jgi:hypothetical protein
MLENKFIFTNAESLKKKLSFITSSIKDYIKFLDNYNFLDVGDEPTINNYYKFLRKEHHIDEKIRALGVMSDLSGNIKKMITIAVDNKILASLILIVITFVFPILYGGVYHIVSAFYKNYPYISAIFTILILVCISYKTKILDIKTIPQKIKLLTKGIIKQFFKDKNEKDNECK